MPAIWSRTISELSNLSISFWILATATNSPPIFEHADDHAQGAVRHCLSHLESLPPELDEPRQLLRVRLPTRELKPELLELADRQAHRHRPPGNDGTRAGIDRRPDVLGESLHLERL